MRWWHLSFTQHDHINCFCLNSLILPLCHHFSIWISRASLLVSVCVRETEKRRYSVCCECQLISRSPRWCVFACSLGCGLMHLTAVCCHGNRVCVSVCVCAHMPQCRGLTEGVFYCCCSAGSLSAVVQLPLALAGPKPCAFIHLLSMTHHTSNSKA